MPLLTPTVAGSGPARLARWRETLAALAMPVDVRAADEANFTATIAASSVGAVQAIRMKHSPMEIYRTRQLIRKSDPEVFHLALNLDGRQWFAQGKQDTNLEPGDMLFYHSSSPFQSRSDDRVRSESAVALVIPSPLLPLPGNRLKHVVGTTFSGQDPIGALVSQHLRTLDRDVTSMRAVDAARLAHVTVDLIAVMVASRIDAEDLIEPESRDQALFARIQGFIRQHLGDPALSLDSVAAAHHISVRTLHRLFQAHGLTIGGWIRERRLDRCRRDLANSGAEPIGVIAARWGFRDAAHFSRIFKAAYGMSPGRYRLLTRTPAIPAGTTGSHPADTDASWR